jgi:LPXTG-motif cell wall-anchored protein
MTRPGVPSYNTSEWITVTAFGILLVLLGFLLAARRRRIKGR